MVLVPRAVRVRTASGWQDVALQGMQGPGGLLDARKVVATYGNYQTVGSPVASPAQLYADAAGTVPIRLSYTPPVDCWWEVNLHAGLVQALTGTYNYGIVRATISPADVDGWTGGAEYIMQHASVQLYEGYHVMALFKLQAGVAYTVNGTFQVSAGTWQYHAGTESLYMDARAWPRGVAVAALPGSFAVSIGDGSTTVFDIAHNLGVADCTVTVRETGGDLSYVSPEVRRIDNNTVRVIFDVAPASGAYRVLVTGGLYGAQTPYVTTLPASPLDGQEVYYGADPANGVIWHLRYRAAASGSYKWECVGGPPMNSTNAVGFNTSAAGPSDWTGGPAITVPRSGEYMVSFAARGEANSASGGWYEIRPRVGATAPAADDAITMFFQGAGAGNSDGGTHSMERKMTLAAGDNLHLAVSTSTVAVAFSRPSLSLLPVRLS